MSRTPRIFLCYRSGDDSYAAALLDDKLSHAFGSRAVFRASRSVSPGESYADAIREALEACHTVLVVIGPEWLHKLRNHDDSTEDWVRTEVASALDHRRRIIPVLLSRTGRLERADLPEDIAALAERQYLTFQHRSIERDLTALIAALEEGDRQLKSRFRRKYRR